MHYPRTSMDDVETLLLAAQSGDDSAWRALVDGHSGLVWSIIRGFRFDNDTANDVFQTVWLRLAENLFRIRQPNRLASWLGQTTRNECVGVTRQRTRLVPTGDDPEQLPLIEPHRELFPLPGENMERDLERQAVVAAFARLGERCRVLLAMLVSDTPPSYVEISEILDIPVGSIGPTRARCLNTLKNSPEISRISHSSQSS